VRNTITHTYVDIVCVLSFVWLNKNDIQAVRLLVYRYVFFKPAYLGHFKFWWKTRGYWSFKFWL